MNRFNPKFIFLMLALITLGSTFAWLSHSKKEKLQGPVETCIEKGNRQVVCECIYERMQKDVTIEKVNELRTQLKNNEKPGEQILQLFNKIKNDCLLKAK